MKIAIVPGSFDPMTLGHLDIVVRALEKYDRVVVAVMQNAEKTYLFSPEERLEIAKQTVADFDRVEVISDNGLLIDLYDRLGASAVCKGWRNETDLAYEKRMAEWNFAHNPRFVTDLFYANPIYAEHSSTRVREAIEAHGSLEGLVDPRVVSVCLKKANSKQA